MPWPVKTYAAPAQAAAFYESAKEQIKGIPGVLDVALSTHLPLRWIGNGEAIEVAGAAELINWPFKRLDAV